MKKTRTPSLLEVAPRNTSFCLCQLQYLVGAKFDLFNALMRSCLAEWSLLVPHKGKELGNICFSKRPIISTFIHAHKTVRNIRSKMPPYPTLPLARRAPFLKRFGKSPPESTQFVSSASILKGSKQALLRFPTRDILRWRAFSR